MGFYVGVDNYCYFLEDIYYWNLAFRWVSWICVVLCTIISMEYLAEI